MGRADVTSRAFQRSRYACLLQGRIWVCSRFGRTKIYGTRPSSVILVDLTPLVLFAIASRHPAQTRPQHAPAGFYNRAGPQVLTCFLVFVLVRRRSKVRSMAVDVDVLPVPGWGVVDFVVDGQVWVGFRVAVPPAPAALVNVGLA
jgi:hypothetical protein